MSEQEVDEIVEDFVVDLSIDNGGYKPTEGELREFLAQENIVITKEFFDILADKWCQK